jgi:hypothetical protein
MKRTRKMPSDPNKAAALTVKLVTERLEQPSAGQVAVSQYLATIGRKGGIKGGKVRAERLTPTQRSEIARNAAKSRWADREQ